VRCFDYVLIYPGTVEILTKEFWDEIEGGWRVYDNVLNIIESIRRLRSVRDLEIG
jgi:hypothetical protein